MWPQHLPRFDRNDPRFLRDPFPTYRYLQTHAPFYFRAEQNEWVVSRHADLVELLRHPAIGHAELSPSGQEQVGQGTLAPLQRMARIVQENDRRLRLWLVMRNAPDHTRMRRVMQPAFSSQVVEQWRAQVSRMAHELIDRVAAAREMELIQSFAHRLPFSAICDLMEIPQQDREMVRELSSAIAEVIEDQPTPAAYTKGLMAVGTFYDYFERLLASRMRPSPTSVIGRLVQGFEDGHMSREEMISNCVFVFFAGHTTTEQTIGSGVAFLLLQQQWQTLLEEPALLPSAVNEIVRLVGPSQFVRRVAHSDVELGDHTIRQGQRLVLLFAAANRDPATFDEPDTLNLRRHPNPHLGFGRGMHHCLGARFAQMVVEEALAALTTRLPTLALRERELVWANTFMMRGLARLDVIW